MLTEQLQQFDQVFGQCMGEHRGELQIRESGSVTSVAKGVVMVSGLPGVRSQELLEFACGDSGIAFNLDETEIGVVLLGGGHDIQAGMDVFRTGRVVDIPVGYELLGRVVIPRGEVLDELGPLRTQSRWPIEREAPAIIERAAVTAPLETGIKVVDALIPVGRGQRELILGDRQTGKTSVALSTLINQREKKVICIYCAVGQQSASVANAIELLGKHRALANTVVLVASGDQAPGLQFIAPYAATSIAEYFMHQGEDVLIVYDDLTRHARAYREMSLLLRRPPGREAFPGDIFYIHARLLERATRLCPAAGGGSLTALPVLETEDGNIAAYIATNLISITDGQIYLSPELFSKGLLPAISVGKSVSRVGGKTQLPGYRAVAGDLRLSYSQFEELEAFARFGTRLDDATRHAIDRGQRVREVLKQREYELLSSCEQLFVLLALTQGRFDHLPLDQMRHAESVIVLALRQKSIPLYQKILSGERLDDSGLSQALAVIDRALQEAGLTQAVTPP